MLPLLGWSSTSTQHPSLGGQKQDDILLIGAGVPHYVPISPFAAALLALSCPIDVFYPR